MYFYESPVGVFWIKPYQGNTWLLGIEEECLGRYYSAVAAADDVYLHATGFAPWDSLDGIIFDAPTDVYEWCVKR